MELHYLSNMAYLYRHIRLDKNEVFYVGIGTTNDNYKRAYDTIQRSDFWKKITKKSDYIVEIVFDNLTEKESKLKEQEFIDLYGRKDKKEGTLCNMTDGGEGNKGWIPSKKWRETKSKSRKGTSFNQEWKEKLSDAAKKRGLQHNWSKKSREKLSKAMKGRKPPQSTIDAVRKANKGRPKTREELEKLAKPIIDENTGIFYYTWEVAELYGVKIPTVRFWLHNQNKNKTNLKWA